MAADLHILAAARQAIERHGWRDATLERIADEAGLSRMTLHRRGVTREDVLESLAQAFEAEYRGAMWPALTAPGSARERLEQALSALCDMCDANMNLLAALGESARSGIFHEQGDAVMTRSVFTEQYSVRLGIYSALSSSMSMTCCPALMSAAFSFGVVSSMLSGSVIAAGSVFADVVLFAVQDGLRGR